jgi:hypothetical protein
MDGVGVLRLALLSFQVYFQKRRPRAKILDQIAAALVLRERAYRECRRAT